MIAKGQKRKQEEDHGGYSLGFDHQWQSVLDISLDKYQRGQELPEPSLRRSVLIANTLRQITLESKPLACNMEEERSLYSTAPSPQVKESRSEHCQSTVTKCNLDATNSQAMGDRVEMPCFPLKKPVSGCAGLNAPANPIVPGEEDEDWGSMSSDPDFSVSAAISSILSELDSTMEGCRALTVPQSSPRTPLKSLENLPGPDDDALGSRQGFKGHWSCSEGLRVSECSLEVFEVMRSSYLGDVALDDLFQDIDTSLLEREMGSLGVRGGTRPSPGDPLYSLSHNQSQKNLPSYASMSSSTSSFSSTPPCSSNQGHMKELHELDHIWRF